MTGVKNKLSGTRATLTAKTTAGEEITVAVQNNVPGKIYINVGGKEAWIRLEEFRQMLGVLYPAEGRHVAREVRNK